MKYLPKSKWKRVGLIMLLIFGLIQFYPRPAKNISPVVTDESIEKLYPVPDSVMSILKSACYDCHSNNTHYPWYSNIQPVSLFLNRHIVEGKKELNFDEFGSYSTRRQQSKLKAIASQVRDREMPLRSYSIMHKNARLTSGERDYIITYFLQKIKEFK
jgi:hypothetical protein